MKTYKNYKDMIDRMKTAHKQNQLRSNTNTPDTDKRQDKIQDLEKNEIFKDLRKYFNKEIIVWGTGRYAQEVVNKSFLFKLLTFFKLSIIILFFLNIR